MNHISFSSTGTGPLHSEWHAVAILAKGKTLSCVRADTQPGSLFMECCLRHSVECGVSALRKAGEAEVEQPNMVAGGLLLESEAARRVVGSRQDSVDASLVEHKLACIDKLVACESGQEDGTSTAEDSESQHTAHCSFSDSEPDPELHNTVYFSLDTREGNLPHKNTVYYSLDAPGAMAYRESMSPPGFCQCGNCHTSRSMPLASTVATTRGRGEAQQQRLEERSDEQHADPIGLKGDVGTIVTAELALLRRASLDPLRTEISHSGTSLHLAVLRGHVVEVTALLDHPLLQLANVSCDGGLTALHVAAMVGQGVCAKLILGHARFVAADVHSADGGTALHWAARLGHAGVVEVLVEHTKFTEASAKTHHGCTALHLAALHSRVNVVSRLLRSARFRQPDPCDRVPSAIFLSSLQGHTSVVELLLGLDRQTHVNWASVHGTALHAAAWAGHSEVAQTLLKHEKFSALWALRSGRMALDDAAEQGHTKVLFAFVRCPRFRGSTFVRCLQSALAFATKAGHEEIVEHLHDTHPNL